MSTRSRIGIVREDGTVVSVYCHSDGYPSGVGKTLLTHYTTREKIEALVALGDLSCLGEEIGEKHDFDEYDPRQCRAYHRDRNDPFKQMTSPSVMALELGLVNSGLEWCYLWDEVVALWGFSAVPFPADGRKGFEWEKLTPKAVAERD
jgi:hypothetical protein